MKEYTNLDLGMTFFYSTCVVVFAALGGAWFGQNWGPCLGFFLAAVANGLMAAAGWSALGRDMERQEQRKRAEEFSKALMDVLKAPQTNVTQLPRRTNDN